MMEMTVEFMIQDWDHTVTTDPMIEICIVRFKFKKAASIKPSSFLASSGMVMARLQMA